MRTPPSLMDLFEYAEICPPSAMDEGIELYRGILSRHHAAVMGGDRSSALKIRTEASRLAIRLNGGSNFGMSAHSYSSACVLERETSALYGETPIWGQLGNFIVSVDGNPVRIEMDGLLGNGYPAFNAHSIDRGPAFFSETGFRCFFFVDANTYGMTVDALVVAVIQAHVEEKQKKPAKKKRKAVLA